MRSNRTLAGAISRLFGLGIAALVAVTANAASNKTADPQIDALRAEIVRNPAQGLSHIEQLEATARGRPADLKMASFDWLRAEALIRMNQPRQALGVIAGATKVANRLAPNSKLAGDLAISQGAASAAIGDIQTALREYQHAHKVFVSADEPRGQAIALLSLASIYADAGDYQNALRYNADSIAAYSSDPGLLLSAQNNNGNALTKLGKFREAQSAYENALQTAKSMNSPLLEARVLENLAAAQIVLKDYPAAAATLNQLRPLVASGPAAARLPIYYGVAAQLAYARGAIPEAATLIERTFAGVDLRTTTMPLRDYHRTAYQIFRARGEDTLAIRHLEAFKRLDDEARQLAASSNAALMSAQFDFARQDAKILEGQRKIAVTEKERAQLYTNAVMGLLIAASVIAALLLIGFVSIRRSRDQVRAANATLSTTNVALERALAAKTEFLATTSHEIRTPLNGILGMTQVILSDRALSQAMRGKIELVHGAGQTMKALVDDILDVAKMETGELVIRPEEMDLTRLLGDAGQVWAGQAETKGITLAIEINEAPGRIVADEVRLRQIVFNLMSNAIKFTDRGHVRLTAVVGSDEEGERLIIRIEDSGIGIPAAQLETIFESFRQVDGGTTRRHGGTGLGLAICRNLAEAMGGTVRVESTIGLGSTFTLDLPLVRGQASGNDSAGERREIENLADAAMLLIEANPLSQGILRAVIGGAVRSLHIVSDLDAANAALQGDIVDHVVADGGALGLDAGAAATLAAATHAANARLTLLWPAPDDATRTALADAGADQIIAKPIAAPELLAALQNGYTGELNSRDIAA